MSDIFLIADTHFGHANVLTFKKDNGELLRPGFHHITEHDEYLIECWNSVVKDQDKVYHLGDIGFKSFTALSLILSRLNGQKILIKGNHDNFKLSQYQQYFKDVRATHILDKFVLSHVPVHPECLTRWDANIHGHLHSNVIRDKRYINVSVEQINYTPISFEELKKNWKGGT